MADSVTPEQNKTAKTILKTLKELRLEVISRSGLVPQKSYVGHSSTLDIIWEVTSQELMGDIINIIQGNYDDLDKALQEYKDNFVNRFMTLYHEHIVRPSKYNWNWDQT